MKKDQVFVRAKSPAGKWGNHDVLDLDEQSFRAFVIEMFKRHGMVVHIKDEALEGEDIVYQSTVEEKA